MKIPHLLLACAFLIATSIPQQKVQAQAKSSTENLLDYQDKITESYLKKHLSVLAHDSLQGRETAMPGQKMAASYLAKQFDKLGLKPVGDVGTYFQKFDLNTTVNDSIVFETYKKTERGHVSVSRSVSSNSSSANFIRRGFGTAENEGEIVYAGYGVENGDLGINHLEGIELKGKWVMVFETLPQVVEDDTLYKSRRQFLRSWFGSIAQRGAAGILVISGTDMESFKEAAMANRQSFGEPRGMQLAYREQQRNTSAFGYNEISPAHAAKLLGLNDVAGLMEREEELMKNIKSFEPMETGYSLKQSPYAHRETMVTENVLGLIEGADPKLKEEVVVLSAHYDHVGVGQPDSTGDGIYNGANDDGSGTVGVLSAARAMATARDNGVHPQRSVLFLMVSGEEKGLLGSRYYSDHPVIPMGKTVANINTDMIGRVDPEHRKAGNKEYVYIIGAEIISSQLDSLLVAANKKSANLELDKKYNDLNDPNQFYRRSDHWNFGRFGVPFIFFFNGVHEDYHRPSDEIEKMHFELLAKTARTMYATTVLVANTDKAPEVDNQEFIEITKGN